jgi:hypothetical protein
VTNVIAPIGMIFVVETIAQMMPALFGTILNYTLCFRRLPELKLQNEATRACAQSREH